MKRDDDLIRQIMLDLEALPAGEMMESTPYTADGHGEQSIFEHFTLMDEAGLIVVHSHVRGGLTIERLTMAGHDYLANIREPKRWQKVKAVAGGLGLKVIAKVAADLATKQALSLID